MDADEVALAVLGFRKDALIAQLDSVVSRWQLMEGAAYATMGLGIVGFLDGRVAIPSLVVLLLLGSVIVVFAGRRLKRDRADFVARLAKVLLELERLKKKELP